MFVGAGFDALRVVGGEKVRPAERVCAKQNSRGFDSHLRDVQDILIRRANRDETVILHVNRFRRSAMARDISR